MLARSVELLALAVTVAVVTLAVLLWVSMALSLILVLPERAGRGLAQASWSVERVRAVEPVAVGPALEPESIARAQAPV